MNGHDPDDGEDIPSESEPQTLLPNATVTIRFDGLIYTAYNEKKKLYQAAIHAKAEGHQLTVELLDGESEERLFPTDLEDKAQWDRSLEAVSKRAPFWLFVDSGEGMPRDFSAQLHLPPDPATDKLSFDHVLNFERLYKHKITLIEGQYAEFNFPQGTCYSALNKKAKLSKVDKNASPVGRETEINVSTIGAIDIDSVSDDKVRKEIVLADKNGDKIFKRLLENGKHYLINITNSPIKNAHGPDGPEHPEEHPDAEQHFLQFYELFTLDPKELRFNVTPIPSGVAAPEAPPCISGTGGKNGLP